MSSELKDFEEFLKVLLKHSSRAHLSARTNSTTATGQPYRFKELNVSLFRTHDQTHGWENALFHDIRPDALFHGIRPGAMFCGIRFPDLGVRNLGHYEARPWDLNRHINEHVMTQAPVDLRLMTKSVVKHMFGRCFSMGIKAFTSTLLNSRSIIIQEFQRGEHRSIVVTIHFPQVDGLQCVVSYEIWGLTSTIPGPRTQHAEVIRNKVMELVKFYKRQYQEPRRNLNSILRRQLTGRTPILRAEATGPLGRARRTVARKRSNTVQPRTVHQWLKRGRDSPPKRPNRNSNSPNGKSSKKSPNGKSSKKSSKKP